MNNNNILCFFAGDYDYRVDRLNSEAQRKNIKIRFVNVDKILFNNKFIIKNNYTENIGYIIGSFYKSTYLLDILSKNIYFPQAKSFYLGDKFSSHIFFKRNDIKTPDTILISNIKTLDNSINEIGEFPCVAKKTFGSGGEFVSIVKNKKEILNFIARSSKGKSIESIFPRYSAFILQKYIKESSGVDYRVLCLKNNVLGIIKRSSKNKSDFRANISLGGKGELVGNIPELEKLSKKIMRKSGLFFAGIDFIKGKDGYYAIEINTSPQFEGFENATNINIAEKILNNLII